MSQASSQSSAAATGGSIGSDNGVNWTLIIIAVVVIGAIWMFKRRK